MMLHSDFCAVQLALLDETTEIILLINIHLYVVPAYKQPFVSSCYCAGRCCM